MGVQERAKRKKEVHAFGMLKANEKTIKDQAKLIKELQATVLAYPERVNMYEVKVGKLRRTIGEYIDKYGLQ